MEEAIEALKNRGTILYPTDTIWGIGCDATNDDACQKIIRLKNRPEDKSFIILVDSIQMIEKYIPNFPDVCYDLLDVADKPLTIIYPNARGIAHSILAEDGSVGIRLTRDPICQKLIRSIRKPLVSTSANISGEPSPSCYADISDVIRKGVDAIVMERLDEKRTTPSQIIKVGLDYSIQVIRK